MTKSTFELDPPGAENPNARKASEKAPDHPEKGETLQDAGRFNEKPNPKGAAPAGEKSRAAEKTREAVRAQTAGVTGVEDDDAQGETSEDISEAFNQRGPRKDQGRATAGER